ncbi:MAG: Stk1 family PASTA domain-containing Ser/Thr kinase [Clostridia bacterium]|nr:Stk1 family PASTA domain-containing Ser/Thr kinase [Clostridia bacterium]
MDLIVLSNRYKLIEKIGTGGMAHVYKALDMTLDRTVAIKILKEEFLEDEEFVQKFHNEAQAVAKLSNPNIVGVFDVALDDKYHYIVMEYIEGVTLSDYIETKGALSGGEAMNIASQICKALIHAHKNNVIHRDIKPHNILLAKDGVAKVADFGIAKAITNKTMTLSGRTIGSVHYFSPEQARGGFVDVRTDLYSLGCVIYEMVTGKLPYEGETPVVVAVKHIQEKVKQPKEINSEVSDEINSLVLKAMSKSADERFQSASEMLKSIDSVVDGKEFPKEFDLTLDFVKAKDRVKKQGNLTKDFTPVKVTKEIREEYDFTLAKSKQKRYTFSKVLAIFSAILLILLLSFYGIKELITTIIPPVKTYEVKDYTNLMYDDVKPMLENDFNIVVEKKEEFNNDIVEGVITKQSIAPGIVFKELAVNKIVFTVSMGPELIEIKDYTSFEYRIAESDLTKLGLVPVKEEVMSETVPEGGIIRTDPEAGMKVDPGSDITIYVSLGPNLDKVIVPDFYGMTKEQYVATINEYNLKVGDISPSNLNSDTAKVVRQYPAAGDEVYEQTEIHVEFQEENMMGDRLMVKYQVTPVNLNELNEPIKVYVEFKPTDTLVFEILYNQEHLKTDFPLELTIPVPVDGKSSVKVIYNNVYTETFDLMYDDYKADTSLTVTTPVDTTQGGN